MKNQKIIPLLKGLVVVSQLFLGIACSTSKVARNPNIDQLDPPIKTTMSQREAASLFAKASTSLAQAPTTSKALKEGKPSFWEALVTHLEVCKKAIQDAHIANKPYVSQSVFNSEEALINAISPLPSTTERFSKIFLEVTEPTDEQKAVIYPKLKPVLESLDRTSDEIKISSEVYFSTVKNRQLIRVMSIEQASEQHFIAVETIIDALKEFRRLVDGLAAYRDPKGNPEHGEVKYAIVMEHDFEKAAEHQQLASELYGKSSTELLKSSR
jgi:hypothetical protein